MDIVDIISDVVPFSMCSMTAYSVKNFLVGPCWPSSGLLDSPHTSRGRLFKYNFLAKLIMLTVCPCITRNLFLMRNIARMLMNIYVPGRNNYSYYFACTIKRATYNRIHVNYYVNETAAFS